MDKHHYQNERHLSGSGSIFRGNRELYPVDYDIRISEDYGESGRTIVGSVTTEHPDQIFELMASGSMLTLKLENGQRMDLTIVDANGAIEPASDFY